MGLRKPLPFLATTQTSRRTLKKIMWSFPNYWQPSTVKIERGSSNTSVTSSNSNWICIEPTIDVILNNFLNAMEVRLGKREVVASLWLHRMCSRPFTLCSDHDLGTYDWGKYGNGIGESLWRPFTVIMKRDRTQIESRGRKEGRREMIRITWSGTVG